MGSILRIAAGTGVIIATWLTRARVLAEAASAGDGGTPTLWGVPLSTTAFHTLCALIAFVGAALIALGVRGVRGHSR